jgi:hypothetical protein
MAAQGRPDQQVCSRIFISEGEAFPEFCRHPGLLSANRQLAELKAGVKMQQSVIIDSALGVVPRGIVPGTVQEEGVFDAWAKCASRGCGEGCDQFVGMTPAILEIRKRNSLKRA